MASGRLQAGRELVEARRSAVAGVIENEAVRSEGELLDARGAI
jgi:hypothetical protein